MRTLLVALFALLASAAPASAAVTVSSEKGELRVVAGAGSRDSIGIASSQDFIQVTGRAAADTVVGPGCEAATPTGVRCDRKGVKHVSVELGDGDDAVGLDLSIPSDPPVTVAGGDGVDSVDYGSGPVTVTLDGKSDDGRGRDDIHPDVENVKATDADDTLTGSDSPNALTGDAGTDVINGAGGDDFIDALDFVDCESEGDCERPERDTVTCGDGFDTVDADTTDEVAADCELVARNGTIRLTESNDDLTGFRGNLRILGFGGQDRLVGLGNDTLNGGPGQDTLIAGKHGRSVLAGGTGRDLLFSRGGSDRLEGGSAADSLVGRAGKDTLIGGSGRDHMAGDAGNDRIVSRDRRRERDVVRCGRGRDVVVADRRDRVFGDCERVIRRR